MYMFAIGRQLSRTAEPPGLPPPNPDLQILFTAEREECNVSNNNVHATILAIN